MFDKHALSLWLKKIGISYKAKKTAFVSSLFHVLIDI